MHGAPAFLREHAFPMRKTGRTNLIGGNLRKPETLMEDNKLSNTAGSAKIQELATTGPSLV
ncbi:hypothetical protein RCCGE510_30421 (plasmid) [Rhizobium sp. CCGE 510]|nr:hypothetical protein RCCGE510_30421 [Rhizobium sp. CCGE 510]